jgi:hypothetical protein
VRIAGLTDASAEEEIKCVFGSSEFCKVEEISRTNAGLIKRKKKSMHNIFENNKYTYIVFQFSNLAT